MQIEGRLTDLSNKELENLYDDAIRLAQAGTPIQKAEMEGILPMISDEVSRRFDTLHAQLVKQRNLRNSILVKARRRGNVPLN
jgi:hypothetical protein